jgi:hypothetical protein
MISESASRSGYASGYPEFPTREKATKAPGKLLTQYQAQVLISQVNKGLRMWSYPQCIRLA